MGVMDTDAVQINALLRDLCELTGADGAFLMLMEDNGTTRIVAAGGGGPAATHCRRMHAAATERYTVLSPTTITMNPAGGKA